MAAITTNPNQLYQQIGQLAGAQPSQELANQLNQTVQQYNQGTQATYLIPDQLKAYLGQISPLYTQNKQQVLAQFSDPNSPLFISNPFSRLQAAQQAENQQGQTYSQILQGVQNLMGLGLEQKKQQVSGLQSAYTNQQDLIKAQQQALQTQFNNALRLQANQRAAAAGGANPSYGTAYVYAPNGTDQIGIAHINPKNPQDVQYTDLTGKPLDTLPQGFRLGGLSYQNLNNIQSNSDISGLYDALNP